MFNGSVWNGASFNGGSGGVRVLLASAILSVSAASYAEPLHIHEGVSGLQATAQIESAPRLAVRGSVDLLAQAVFENSWNQVRRPARTDTTFGASLEVERPIDLMLSVPDLLTRTYAETTGFAYREGLGDLSVTTGMSAWALVHSFYADGDGYSWFEAEGWTVRPGAAEIEAQAVLDSVATRIHQAKIDAPIQGFMEADAEVYAGGIAVADIRSWFHAEPHLNGIQIGDSIGLASATMTASGDRIAGGLVDARVKGEFDGDPLPGRSVGQFYLDVSSDLFASWWAYTSEQADIRAGATLESQGSRIQHGEVDAVVSAELAAEWSRIVEPRERIVAASAVLEARPWGIRPSRSEGQSIGVFEVDGRVAERGSAVLDARMVFQASARIAERGTTNGTASALMEVRGTRVPFGYATFDAVGSIIRSRLSVNLTTPAPDNRRMEIAFEDRTMRIPFEDRTMVVS